MSKNGTQTHAPEPSYAPLADEMETQDYDNSPPRTPPSQLNRVVKGKGVAGVARQSKARPSVQGVFGDTAGGASEREAQAEHRRERSNSHDLSWSPNRQRVSVVDNMLMSLDQFSGAGDSSYNSDYGNYDKDDRPQAYSRYTSNTPPGARSRAQTASSASSDYNPHTESTPPKTRTHRSNSSQNFQSSLGRIDSVRRTHEDKEEAIIEQNPKKMGNARPSGAPRRSSKGSGSSSFDYGRLAGGQWQRMSGRRSASFDHGYTRPDLVAGMTKPAFIPSMAADTNEFYHTIDAAPTPTVPAGPRQTDSPMRSPGLRSDSSLSASKPPVKRRGSMRSPMGLFGRNERSVSPHKGNSRTEKLERPSNLRHHSSNEASTTIDPNAETPGRTTPQMSGLVASAPGSAYAARDKDKPGFFRRVFGSNKAAYTGNDSSPPQARRNASEPMNSIMGQLVNDTSRRPSQQYVQSMPQKDTIRSKKTEKTKDQPPLNKKPSFFRRRKKSVSENVLLPEPMPQLQSQWTAATPGVESPSSLRHALDPYLTKSNPSKVGLPHDTEPGTGEWYESDPNTKATIRPVNTAQEADLVVRDSPKQRHRSKNSKDLKISTELNALDKKPDSSKAAAAGNARPSAHKHTRTQSDVDKALPGLPKGGDDKENVKPTAAASKSAPMSSYNSYENAATTTTTTTTTTVASHHRQASDTVTSVKVTDGTGNQKTERLWLLGNDSNEEIAPPPRPPNTTPAPVKALESPAKASPSEASEYKTAVSRQNSPTLDTPDDANGQLAALADPSALPVVDSSAPTNEDRQQAFKLFHGELDLEVSEAATWLGEEGPERARVRKAFMELFDWKNTSILAGLRGFCRQVKLMAETQQLDRLLDALSLRWCECNPRHGFKATDVVHTMYFSIVLLNTDLHIADIEQKMTRSQFVKNTLPTIRRVVADAAPHAFDQNRNSMLPPPRPPPAVPDEAKTVATHLAPDQQRPPLVTRPSNCSEKDNAQSIPVTPADGKTAEDCGPLVNYPFNGKQSAWELQIEVVLKNFYNSIRQESLPVQSAETNRPPAQSQPSSASLSAMSGGGVLRRSNSMISKAGSESLPARGRLLDTRLGGARWSSKPRSRPRLYPNSIAQSSRTSFDDDTSAISPSASSMWSRVSFGKTGTSMSVHSMASSFPTSDYQQSIGFANALSRTIIREEAAADGEESLRMRPLLEDESLELAGSPWAKEGILKHKHHLESVDKRAKDRNWTECFAVIEKGWMRLFQFNLNNKSLRSKMRNKHIAGGVVGGGNWTENAEPLGSYLLRQSIASALPPPGYSQARPHVWALSLPNGAVHLFQAGTPEIVREFVSSANYWSARMSKEPLVGGVSNVEYGWSDAMINMALVQDSRPSSTLPGPRPSFQNSIRSSIDHSNTARPKLPGDRITISDWAAPAQSMMPSQLLEVDQLRALSTYVKNVEQELKKHTDLRGAMHLAFSPRHPNHIKSMSNWEKKSAYLLHEIVKFTKYIESLEAAQVQKERVYAEREEYEKQKDAEAEALGRGEIPAESEDVAVS